MLMQCNKADTCEAYVDCKYKEPHEKGKCCNEPCAIDPDARCIPVVKPGEWRVRLVQGFRASWAIADDKCAATTRCYMDSAGSILSGWTSACSFDDKIKAQAVLFQAVLDQYLCLGPTPTGKISPEKEPKMEITAYQTMIITEERTRNESGKRCIVNASKPQMDFGADSIQTARENRIQDDEGQVSGRNILVQKITFDAKEQ